jgi:O-antigen/teichoic acid export membrane protein
MLVPLGVLLSYFFPAQLRFIAGAVALYAMLYNLTALLQFSLQAARIFRPVAISFVLAPALSCACVFLWQFILPSSYLEVISIYVFASCVPLLFLLRWTQSWKRRSAQAMKGVAWSCIVSGFPITLVNTGAYLIQCADRLAISWTASIQDFAQYSLAASAMAVPLTAIQACSKVFFSHLANLEVEGRQRIYRLISQSLLLIWAMLLPFYFVLHVVVGRFLPKFAPSLEYARVLLLAIPFLAAIQILQLSFAYLHGMQKRLFVRTAVVLVISLGLMSVIALTTHSLRLMAAVQVALIAGWWFLNEWTLRELTRQGAADWIRFVSLFAAAASSYWFTSRPGIGMLASVPLHYLIILAAAGIGCRDELIFLYSHLLGKRALVIAG